MICWVHHACQTGHDERQPSSGRRPSLAQAELTLTGTKRSLAEATMRWVPTLTEELNDTAECESAA